MPELFKALFPSWFAGFAFSAIAIGALVPAAVMSIGAANLFTRNIWKAYVNPAIDHAGEANVAKITSLVVKVGALAFILFLPTQYALDLQLLGGLWILQTFPSLVFGLFTRWFRASGLLLGWAAGMIWGSWTAWSNGLKPLATLTFGDTTYTFYVGLGAVILNVVVAVIATAVLVRRIAPPAGRAHAANRKTKTADKKKRRASKARRSVCGESKLGAIIRAVNRFPHR